MAHLVDEDDGRFLAVPGELAAEQLLRLVRSQLPVSQRLVDPDVRLLRLRQPQSVHLHKLKEKWNLIRKRNMITLSSKKY